jgi:hypothetical protein
MTKRINQTQRINLSNKKIFANLPQNDDDDSDLSIMSDARYLRSAGSLIGDALQKGFDVLQMANGDIVMTGTKTVVYTYTWDEDKGKLVRAKANRKRSEDESESDADSQDEYEDA